MKRTDYSQQTEDENYDDKKDVLFVFTLTKTSLNRTLIVRVVCSTWTEAYKQLAEICKERNVKYETVSGTAYWLGCACFQDE